MSNARIIIGATGGQIELSEGLAATGATGYGKLFVPSGSKKLTFVDSKGDCTVISDPGRVKYDATYDSLWTPDTNIARTGTGCQWIAVGFNQTLARNGSRYITIGDNATVNQASDANSGISIGYNACGSSYNGIAIGNATNSGQQAMSIGHQACGTFLGLAVGEGACALQVWNIAIGSQAKTLNSGSFTPGVNQSIAIGRRAYTCSAATNAIAIGSASCSTANGGIAMGNCAIVTHADSTAFGCNINTERASTFHTRSILAYGQGVSKGYDVGSTGGNVSVNWDRSNTQKITLASNITDLRLDNPIQGGIYSLVIEQSSSAGNTITWPASIKWPGGTPPTLTSGATGDTDIISLIYDPAGGTGYFGNSNLNFL